MDSRQASRRLKFPLRHAAPDILYQSCRADVDLRLYRIYRKYKDIKQPFQQDLTAVRTNIHSPFSTPQAYLTAYTNRLDLTYSTQLFASEMRLILTGVTGVGKRSLTPNT